MVTDGFSRRSFLAVPTAAVAPVEGVIQFDASCIHGSTKRAGAVGCLGGIKTPREVARLGLTPTRMIHLNVINDKRAIASITTTTPPQHAGEDRSAASLSANGPPRERR